MKQIEIAAVAGPARASGDERQDDAARESALHAADTVPVPMSMQEGRRRSKSHPGRIPVPAADEEREAHSLACDLLDAAVFAPMAIEGAGGNSDTTGAQPVTPGIDDRAFSLAMVAGSATPQLRTLTTVKKQDLRNVRPKTRAECQRRFGGRCVCDPSNEAGCGGAFCRT